MSTPLLLSSVPAQTPYIQYIAGSGQTVFPYPFEITQDSDLLVVYNGTPWATDAGYTVSGQGATNGGAILLNTPASAGDIVTLYRDIEIQRLTQFSQNGGFSSAAFNAEFNNVYLILQQLEQSIVQCLQVPNTNHPAPVTSLTPTAYANKYLAFDANGNPVPAALTSSGTVTASLVASLLNAVPGILSNQTTATPQTTAEAAAGVTPTYGYYDEGDIRRYGATTAATDNSVAINNAMLVSGAGGPAAFVPGGTWNYTSTLNLGSASFPNANIYGLGVASILQSNGCDGLTVLASGTYAGTRFVRDLFLQGSSATSSTNSGIAAALSSRVTGIQFSNLTIENFVYGVNVTGTGGIWNSAFNDCFLYNNYHGYYFNGLVAVMNIRGGEVQQGAITGGSGNHYGLYTASSSQQSIHVAGTQIYGYDVGATLAGVYVCLENCDIANCGIMGVQVASESGIVVVRDCWVQLKTTSAPNALTGISIADQGSAIYLRVTIEGCQILGNTNSGTMGIYCGSNQYGVSITKNTIGGGATTPFTIGVGGLSNYANSPGISVKYNTFYATTTEISLNTSNPNCDIGPNTHQNASATPLAFSAGTPAGLSYYASGSFTATLTGMTATVNGTINWVANGKVVTLSPVAAGIQGTSNATTMTATGMPVAIAPNSQQTVVARTIDNGATTYGVGVIGTTGTITFYKDPNNAAFTGSGTKGINQLGMNYILG